MRRVGRLDQLVTIQALTEQQDAGDGGVATRWANVATEVWAEVKFVAGRETVAGQRLEASTTHRVRLRYRAWLTSRHRLLWGGRVLTIESVGDPEGRREEQILLCQEQTDGL